MLESLYFWKNKSGGSPVKRMLLIGLIVVLVLAVGGAGGWYYFIKVPADKAAKEAIMRQQAAAQKLQNDIKSVKTFYEKSLEGGSIEQTLLLLSEMRRSQNDFNVLNIEGEAFTCDAKKCEFSYNNAPGTILTLPQKMFWGKPYKATVTIKGVKKKGKKEDKSDFRYDGIESKLNVNKLQAAYNNKLPLDLAPCNDVVAYILTYNSFLKSTSPSKSKSTVNGEIVLKTMPKSTVIDLESQLAKKVQAYGLMAGTWEMELKSEQGLAADNNMNLQLMLFKQAYRDAFIIKRIESTDKGIKVSGGLVCKA